MKWQHWTAGGMLIFAFLIYPSYIQQDMVFTWLDTESKGISEKTGWVFGKYSSGRIVQARECRETAVGWSALLSILPLSLATVLVSFYIGALYGYFTRDDDNATRHKRVLSEMEMRYKDRIEGAEKTLEKAANKEKDAREQLADAQRTMSIAKHLQKWATEREQELQNEFESDTKALKKKLQTLEEDHRNRLQKIEGLEKDRFDLKKKSNTLEKENILLGEENLKLLKEIMALKKEKSNS